MFQLRLFFTVLLIRYPCKTDQSQRLIEGNRGMKRDFYQQGVSYAHFAVHKFQYLQGSPLGSSCEVDKPRDCALACVNNPPCFSLNLGLLRNAKGKLQCELLSEDKYRDPDKMILTQQFHHFSIKTPCSSNPCKNAGTCFPNYEEHKYHCICAPGYTGPYCTTDIDECSSQPCKNGGTCTDQVNKYVCSCQAGYSGIDCQTACVESLGMENRRITSAQLSASSQYDVYHSPNLARLRNQISGNYKSAWVASLAHQNQHQWIQIDLRIITRVTHVATQGRGAATGQWVTKYKLQYGDDGSSFQVFKQEGDSVDKLFVGNSDDDTVVKHALIPPIKAQFVRLVPTEWHNYITLRMELYGCLENIQALGMESGAIADSQLTTSSELNVYHGILRSRLHTKEISTQARGAWVPSSNDVNQWLQIDLGKISNVTNVATQGRNGHSPLQCVTKYKLQHSDEGATFLFYKRTGQSIDAVFVANFDHDTIVYQHLNPPVTARYIRIRPTEWQSYIAMRVELYTNREDTMN